MNRNPVGSRIRLALLCVTGAAVAISCVVLGQAGPPARPALLPDPASDAAFVRKAVPVLYGRKARGYDEVKLLSDLVAATNRELVLRALMARPPFVDHWSEVLVDDLRIDREGTQAQPACYGAPMRALPVGGFLARSIVDINPQSSAPGGAFNMSDVIRSAIELDNLFPLYRINLYPHAGMDVVGNDELLRREVVGAKFGEIYLNRQMGCLVCHNSEFSMSGEASGWKRTWPIRGLFEKALFGASVGESPLNAYAMFRVDAKDGPLRPWGLASCGTFKTTLPNDPRNVNAHFVQPQGRQFGVHNLQNILQSGYLDLRQNGLQRALPPEVQQTCDFCAANCQGTTVDINAAANNAPNATQVKTLLISRCQSCHGGANAAADFSIPSGEDWAADMIAVPSTEVAGEIRVVPANASGSYLVKKLLNTGIAGNAMPDDATYPLTDTEIDLIRGWIDGLPPLTACAVCQNVDCGQPPQEVQGHEAFAFLIAARIADNVWETVMGYPVTIANYYPRNEDQRSTLWNLTEYRLLPSNWSLRELLVRIMTSSAFNRVPPKLSTSATAYNLPPNFDPWIVADPRIPPASDPGYDPAQHPKDHNNAMSDAVHRYSARSLTNSVHEALGWQAPQRFPGAAYPSKGLMRSIGFYFSEQQPGFDTVDFQGLLAWESVHGRCVKPQGVATDWVDRLMTAIENFSPGDPGGPLTVGDVATVMRDWLLGHGTIGTAPPVGLSASEVDAIRALFAVNALTVPVSGVSNLEPKLRRLCGMQLESPQFQLAGIAENDLGVKPRIRVCNTAECSYQQMCTALRPAVNALLTGGRNLLCRQDSVLIIPRPLPPVDIDTCPPGICGVIQRFIPPSCPVLGDPVVVGPVDRATAVPAALARASFDACPTQPPLCDPRCTGLDCCGGPIPREGLKQRDMLVVWADGGVVTVAQGVQIRGRERFEPLQRGRTLVAGDLIALPPGSRFEVLTREGKRLRTAAEGLPSDRDRPVIAMMISGPRALQERRPGVAAMKPPVDKIKRVLQGPHAKYGEGGPPLSEERRTSYVYSPEELGLEDLRRRGLLPEQLKK